MNRTLESFSPRDLDGNGVYDENLDCHWIINRQTKKTLYLLIRSIDIEYSEGCRFDYIKVGSPNLYRIEEAPQSQRIAYQLLQEEEQNKQTHKQKIKTKKKQTNKKKNTKNKTDITQVTNQKTKNKKNKKEFIATGTLFSNNVTTILDCIQ